MIKTVVFPDKTEVKVNASNASKAIKQAYAKRYGLTKCEFTSEWSDGSVVTTPCIYDPKTGEVTPEVSKGRIPTGSLEREYITLPDGDEKDVCRVCHGFVLKTEMNPGQAKHDIVEEEVCSDPDCSDEE